MENKKFTKDDLKVGYVVKMRNGHLYMVMPTDENALVLVSEDSKWMSVRDYDSDLCVVDMCGIGRFVNLDIVEVYGFNMYSHAAMHLNTNYRKLLWKREEAKKMTVEEIEKELGYKIEIVS